MQKDFSPAGNLIATHFGLSPNPGCHITKGFCIIDFIVANTHKNSLDFFWHSAVKVQWNDNIWWWYGDDGDYNNDDDDDDDGDDDDIMRKVLRYYEQ